MGIVMKIAKATNQALSTKELIFTSTPLPYPSFMNQLNTLPYKASTDYSSPTMISCLLQAENSYMIYSAYLTLKQHIVA